MIIKKIVLENFKNFEGRHSFNFDNINLIKGKNGSGKSTLIRIAPAFCIYGYSDVPLEKLPTRGKSKSCRVEVHFDDCIIAREYPTKIYIQEVNYPPMIFANNRVAQEWLNNKFQNVDYFRKFRMIDLQQGINILEEGKTSLRKTLCSFNEDMFNKIRKNLQIKKKEREIYNRDNLNIDTIHFPSEKRLHAIQIGLLNLSEEVYSIEKELSEEQRNLTNLISNRMRLQSQKEGFTNQKIQLLKNSACPTCNRRTNKDIKLKILNDFNKNISEINDKIISFIDKIDNQKEEVYYFKSYKEKILKRKDRISEIRYKLETIVKQKDYKWVTKDVEVIKQAIKELDNFSSYYITEWIKILEPIMNDILSKIGFQITFDIDNKGDIDINLIKDGKEYNYKDLSSGQKLITSIAFQLSLLLESNKEGFIIADEGFSNLDTENLKLILELFKNLPFQLLCVIHRLEDIPDGVYVINCGGD